LPTITDSIADVMVLIPSFAAILPSSWLATATTHRVLRHTVARLRSWETKKLRMVAPAPEIRVFLCHISGLSAQPQTMVADGCGWLRSPQFRWLRHGCGGGCATMLKAAPKPWCRCRRYDWLRSVPACTSRIGIATCGRGRSSRAPFPAAPP
jgi:hypothetical protein